MSSTEILNNKAICTKCYLEFLYSRGASSDCPHCGEQHYIRRKNENVCEQCFHINACFLPSGIMMGKQIDASSKFELVNKLEEDAWCKALEIERNSFKTYTIKIPKIYTPVEMLFSIDEEVTVDDRLKAVLYILIDLPIIKEICEWFKIRE